MELILFTDCFMRLGVLGNLMRKSHLLLLDLNDTPEKNVWRMGYLINVMVDGTGGFTVMKSDRKQQQKEIGKLRER